MSIPVNTQTDSVDNITSSAEVNNDIYKRADDQQHRLKSDVHHPMSAVNRPSLSSTPAKSPTAEEATGDARRTTSATSQDDDVVRTSPAVRDDVNCDVIDARRRHVSTSLDASLATEAMTTDVIEEDDVDDDNEDQDVNGRKRKKTRTVFSRHQVISQRSLV